MGKNSLLQLFTVELLNFIQTPLLLKTAAVTMDSVEKKKLLVPLQFLEIINNSIIVFIYLDEKKRKQTKNKQRQEKTSGELFFIQLPS